MPSVHYAKRSFLKQLGVIDPPRTVNQIKSQLRRDPDYFRSCPTSTSDGPPPSWSGPVILQDGGIGREKSVSTSTRSFEKRDDNSPTGVVDAASTFFAGDNDEFSSKDTPSPLLGATAYVSSGRYEGLSGKILIVEARGWWIIDNPQISKKVRSNLCRLVDDGNANMDEIREWYVGRGLGERMPLIVKPGQETDVGEEEEEEILGDSHIYNRNDTSASSFKNNDIAETDKSGPFESDLKTSTSACSCGGFDIPIAEIVKRGRKRSGAASDEMDYTSATNIDDGSNSESPAECRERWQPRNRSNTDVGHLRKGDHQPRNTATTEGGACEASIASFTSKKSDSSKSSNFHYSPDRPVRKRKASALLSEEKDILKEHTPKIVGVYPTGSGKWKVECPYHGKNRYFGQFDTQDQAVMANEVVRAMLEPTKNSCITAVEFESNLKLAKEAAWMAASGSSAGAIAPSFAAAAKQTREAPVVETSTTYSQKVEDKLVHRRELLEFVQKCRIAAEEGVHDMAITGISNDTNLPWTCDCGETLPEEDSEQNVEGSAIRKKKAPRGVNVPPGVYATTSGRWKVECGYKGKNRRFGTYDTLDQAVFINEIIRGVIQATKDADLTDKEIQENVKIVKEGATKALSELGDDVITESLREVAVSNAVTKLIGISLHAESFSEDALLNIEILRYEGGANCDGPKLLSSISQPREGFGLWLNDRKRKWRLQQQRRAAPLMKAHPHRGEEKNKLGAQANHQMAMTSEEEQTPNKKRAWMLGGRRAAYQFTAHQQELKVSGPGGQKHSHQLAQHEVHSQNIFPDAPWFYIDLQGIIQGPFDSNQMRRWRESGFFNADLQISQAPVGPFRSSSSYVSDPFARVLPPPHTSKTEGNGTKKSIGDGGMNMAQLPGAASVPMPADGGGRSDKTAAVLVVVTKPSIDTKLGVVISQKKEGFGFEVTKIALNGLFAGTELKVGMKIESINGRKFSTCAQCVDFLKTVVGQVSIVASSIAPAPTAATVAAPPASIASTNVATLTTNQNERDDFVLTAAGAVGGKQIQQVARVLTSNERLVEVEKWQCDYCPAVFDTYNEASRHERDCPKTRSPDALKTGGNEAAPPASSSGMTAETQVGGKQMKTLQKVAAASCSRRSLREQDALEYIGQVGLEFNDRPHIYNDFLGILNDLETRDIDDVGAAQRVKNLFQGYDDLILGFNAFLPEEYKTPPAASFSAPDNGTGSGDGIVVIDGDNLNSAKDLVYEREPQIVMTTKSKDNEGDSKAISQVDGNAKKKSGVPGVYATASGRWKVECGYQGKNRGFGTYDTLEQAVFIDDFVRGTLQATKNADLTDEEIRENIKLAKEGANHALSELLQNDALPETSRENAFVAELGESAHREVVSDDALLDIEIRRYEGGADCDGPKLVSSTSQPKEGFDVWLANRKRKWRLKQLTNKLDRPKLLLGCLQAEKEFATWLIDRKRKWRQQQGRSTPTSFPNEMLIMRSKVMRENPEASTEEVWAQVAKEREARKAERKAEQLRAEREEQRKKTQEFLRKQQDEEFDMLPSASIVSVDKGGDATVFNMSITFPNPGPLGLGVEPTETGEVIVTSVKQKSQAYIAGMNRGDVFKLTCNEIAELAAGKTRPIRFDISRKVTKANWPK